MSDVIIYNTEDGLTKVELHQQDGTIWLTQLELAELFQTTKQNIAKHIKNVIADRELDEEAVVNYQLTTAGDGKDYQTTFYNLDMVLAIGYRVRSARGAEFRRFASTILKEYLLEGASLNRDLLEDNLSYFKKLQRKIRDIRTSELRYLIQYASTDDLSKECLFKGIDASYYYESHTKFRMEDL